MNDEVTFISLEDGVDEEVLEKAHMRFRDDWGSHVKKIKEAVSSALSSCNEIVDEGLLNGEESELLTCDEAVDEGLLVERPSSFEKQMRL